MFIQKQGRNNRLAGTLGSSKEHWSVVVETLNNDGKPRAVFKYDAVFDMHQNLEARRARFKSLKQIKKRWPEPEARLHKVEDVTNFSLDSADDHCKEVNAGKLQYNPLTDNCQKFVMNLLSTAATDDTGSRYEFESEDMVVHSARTFVHICYAIYSVLNSIFWFGIVLIVLWAMYDYEYAVGAFDATYNNLFGMIATLRGLVIKVNVFASPSWFSYKTFIVFITGNVVWVRRLKVNLREKAVSMIIFPLVAVLCGWVFVWLGLGVIIGVINTVVFYVNAFYIILVLPLEFNNSFHEIFVNPWIDWIGMRIQRIMYPPA